MIKFFKELYVRITSESPEFFKKIRTILLIIAAVSSSLVEAGIDLTIHGYNVAQILAFATVTASIITFLAIKDDVKVKEKIDSIKNGEK